jgi:GR25 family glycosyltransferase involved in LPS biosynthesis
MDALRLADGEAAIHLEDDIILTVDFTRKIEEAVAERPEALIQFFSMRKADQTEGSRWDRKFAMNQCWYCPPGLGPKFLEFTARWMGEHPEGKRSGYDTMMNDALKAWKMPHWIHVPSLVQHRVGKSLIGPRSSKRQSASFVDPTEDS